VSTNDETYNGWANRETWAVALHINNDQGWQESVTELVRTTVAGIDQDPPTYIAAGDLTDTFYANRVGDAIRDNVESVLDPNEAWDAGYYVEHVLPIVTDLGSLWRVDWREIGAAFIEDLGEADDVSSS
jgi:hypothetical protein